MESIILCGLSFSKKLLDLSLSDLNLFHLVDVRTVDSASTFSICSCPFTVLGIKVKVLCMLSRSLTLSMV